MLRVERAHRQLEPLAPNVRVDAVVDAMARLVPGVLGNSASPFDESHLEGLLDFAQYTRPEIHPSGSVPAVLLSGDHARISRWRRQQALLATYRRRPDLLAHRLLSAQDRELLRQGLLGPESSTRAEREAVNQTLNAGLQRPDHSQE